VGRTLGVLFPSLSEALGASDDELETERVVAAVCTAATPGCGRSHGGDLAGVVRMLCCPERECPSRKLPPAGGDADSSRSH
jgi:hypothetical protein